MFLIDTHTHIYLPEFDEDRDEVIERGLKAGVLSFYLPNIDSSSIASMHNLADTYPENCFPMMGLHPCSVKPETWEQELGHIKYWLGKRKYAAIGEIGLDLYWDKTTFEIQSNALKLQCEWALEQKLPVVLHSRESTRECIDLVKPFAEQGLTGVFHCFSGNEEEAKEITGFGFFLGIGGVLTYKKSGLAEAIRDIATEFLVLETDAPYLSPVPFRGKRNEPAYISCVLNYLSTLRNIAPELLAKVILQNSTRLFNAI
jgi:TatD DNase family protein